MAAYERNTEVVKMLLDAGAEVDALTHAGETALLRSVFWQDRDTVNLLLQAGAKPDAVPDAVLSSIGFKDRAEWDQRVRDVQAGR
jgi:ankyrin repeat protein